VAPATAALLASGQSSAELFLDNNHLTVEGSRIVGESVADVLAPLLPAR
jgi:lysophospholipase L1-like esterase